MAKHKGAPSSPSHLAGSASTSSLSDKAGKDQSKAGRASPTLKQRIQRIWAKVEASLWVLGAVFALTYGDGKRNMPDIVLHDIRLKRLWLYVACVFVAINLLIFLYVRLWLAWYRGIRDDWVKAAPFAIPVSTFSWLCAGVTSSVALWPALRYTGPFALVVTFMGAMMAHHLLPSAWKRALGFK